jgi:hypothetical protein
LKTGKLGPRRFMPSNSEIREWCEDCIAELTKLARAGELADRKREVIENGNALTADRQKRMSLDELHAKHGENWGLKCVDAIDTIINDDPIRDERRAALLVAVEKRDFRSMLVEYDRLGIEPRPVSSSSRYFSDVLVSPSLLAVVRGVPLQPSNRKEQ